MDGLTQNQKNALLRAVLIRCDIIKSDTADCVRGGDVDMNRLTELTTEYNDLNGCTLFLMMNGAVSQ